jgi:hypothetical protein
MTRSVLVVTYLIGLVLAVVALDLSNEGWWAAIWIIASVVLGAGTGDFRLAVLSLLAIPVAVPFGLPANTEADPVLPVWVGAAPLAACSSVLILIGAFMRRIVESRRQRTSRSSAGIG